MSVKTIGILDFGIRSHPNNFNESIYKLIKEAVTLEKLGFSRIWFTEHYTRNIESLWFNPQLLIPVIAAHTNKIKIGAAGILTAYKTSIEIASDYKFLNTLFTERIDLGFAKSEVEDSYKKFFESIGEGVERRVKILSKIANIISLFDAEHLYANNGVHIPPLIGKAPEFWNLVGSSKGYAESLILGTNCSRSIVYSNSDLSVGKSELEIYKNGYLQLYNRTPQVNIVVTGTCQKTEKLCKMVLQKSGIDTKLANAKGMLFGTPSMIKDRLEEISEYYEVDEIIFTENAKDHDLRISSFKNLSKLFNLSAII